MRIGTFDLESGITYIIAELSANHGGRLETAKETIRAAKEIGVDAVKLQTYTADILTLDCDREDFKIKGGTLWDDRRLYDLYKEACLPWEWHAELFAYARAIGIDIFSSPFDKSAVDFLEQFEPSAYKIASFEITDHELIRYAASKGRPMIISTGIADIGEIQEAVSICRQEGNDNIILLKCTSAYPAPLEAANLRTIPNLAETFSVISGFSDHTLGVTAPIVAVTLGAKVIEKHFILDKSIGGPDAAFSLDRTEFEAMIKAVRDTEMLLGSVDYSMTEGKMKSRRFSRSLYVVKPIATGEAFDRNNVQSKRPGFGLHPRFLEKILGTIAQRDYEIGERLTLKDLHE